MAVSEQGIPWSEEISLDEKHFQSIVPDLTSHVKYVSLSRIGQIIIDVQFDQYKLLSEFVYNGLSAWISY
jgi:hypothetical protein